MTQKKREKMKNNYRKQRDEKRFERMSFDADFGFSCKRNGNGKGRR